MKSHRQWMWAPLVVGLWAGACSTDITTETTSTDTGTATGTGGQGGAATGGQGGTATGGQGGTTTGGQGGAATGGQGGQGGQGGAATGGQGGAATGGQGGTATGGQGGAATGGQGGQGGQGGGAVACESAPTPTDCDTAHGYTGCCAGSVAYYYYAGELQSDDCSASGEECGWDATYGYICGGSGADPDYPNDMCCGGANPYDDCTPTPDCTNAPVPATCETAHGYGGCCVGSVLYWFDGDAVQSYDCADDASECGWLDVGGYYDCGGYGADPNFPNDMCCGGTNPYGDCPCASAAEPTDCDTAHGYHGCCAGTVAYYYYAGELQSDDCGASGEECGWDATYGYICGGSGADPDFPDDMCCGGTNPYDDCTPPPDCTGAPVPTDCETTHADVGCCVGSVLYWFDGDAVQSYDCADDASECGWLDGAGYYDCGGYGADPIFPNDMCCGGANPYGGC